MILTGFSIVLTIVCAVLAFKLGYVCGQTAERVKFLERFGEENSKTQQNTDVNIDTFHSDLQKIMNYTGVQGNE